MGKLVKGGNEDGENYDMVNQSDGVNADCEVDSHPSTGDTLTTPDNGEDISPDPWRTRTPYRLKRPPFCTPPLYLIKSGRLACEEGGDVAD